MSKKIMKRSLALGALMAFVITGSAMAADAIKNDEINTWDGSSIINTQLGDNVLGEIDEDKYDGTKNRSYGLAVTTGSYTVDKDLNVVNGVSGTERNYGIAIESGSSLTVMGVTDVDVSGTGTQQLRGIRNNGGTLMFKDEVVVEVALTDGASDVYGTSSLGYVTGVDTWNGSTVFDGDSTITANANYKQGINWVNAVQVGDGGTIEFNGSETNLTAINKGYTAQAIQTTRSDSVLKVNSALVNIKSKSDVGVNGIAGNGKVYFDGKDAVVNIDVIIDKNDDGIGDVGRKNAIGAMGSLEASDAVNEFNVTVKGSGVDVVNFNDTNGTAAILAVGDDVVKMNARKFTATVIAGTDAVRTDNTYGIRASAGGQVTVNSAVIDIDVTDAKGSAYGVRANCNDVNFGSTTPYDAAGTINLGSETSVITIDVTAENGYAVGVAAHRSNNKSEGNASAVTVNGQSLTINATGKTAYGILGMNNTTGRATNVSTVTINSADTTINAKSGLVALSQSKINVNGNLTVNSEGGDAIVSRGGATVNINTEGNKVVKLTGDIDFNYNQATSGSKIDAAVNLNLTNADSFFTGKIYKSGDATIPADKDSVTGMNISLSNGAKWNLTGESIVTNATFGADSVLNINGEDFDASITDAYALNASEGTPILTVNEGAKLVIEGADLEKTYNIAKGFAEGAGENWTLEADNALWYADWADVDVQADTLQATIALKNAEQLVNTGVVEDVHADFVATIMKSEHEEAKDVKEFLKKAAGAGATPAAKEQTKEKIAQAFQAGEAAGTSATAANIVKNTTGATTQHMSFSNRPSAHKGGHGPSVSEDKNDGAIWAQYVHGKDKVTDMPMAGTTASYEGKFNGVVLGADFKQVGKYQSGVSFNYGEGDTYSTGSSAYSRNDYDFWGVGYYGAVQNADSNVIFDVNYAKSDTDVEQLNSGKTITASPETTTWSAGVRVEKLIDKGSIQYVPYAGLRYMSIDTDSYTNSLNVVTETERQDIWLLPVGVSFRQDNVYDSGWVVTPKVDLSYIWAFGDTESEMTIDVPGATDVSFSRLGYTVMDDGSFLGSIGLEASKGDWTFGVAYSYQKGEYSRSDKWYVDAKYSF